MKKIYMYNLTDQKILATEKWRKHFNRNVKKIAKHHNSFLIQCNHTKNKITTLFLLTVYNMLTRK